MELMKEGLDENEEWKKTRRKSLSNLIQIRKNWRRIKRRWSKMKENLKKKRGIKPKESKIG